MIQKELKEGIFSNFYFILNLFINKYLKKKSNWLVWASKKPIETYNSFIGRFVSEFGMQGFLSMTSINKFTSPEVI